jgi:hypothetical protein
MSSAYWKVDATVQYSTVQKRSADAEIHEERDYNNIRTICGMLKKTAEDHSEEKVFNADILKCPSLGCLHTAPHTCALCKNFNWELFDHPPYSPYLTPSNYHLFAYLENWFRLQCFSNMKS